MHSIWMWHCPVTEKHTNFGHWLIAPLVAGVGTVVEAISHNLTHRRASGCGGLRRWSPNPPHGFQAAWVADEFKTEGFAGSIG
jgi:hypothetical protein